MSFPLLTLLEAVVAGVATLCTLIGLGGNAWAVSTDTEGKYEFGLFQRSLVHSPTTCTKFDQADAVGDWLNAVRAMVIIGFLLGVACVVVLVVYIINDLKILHLVARLILLLTGDFVLIGITIYACSISPSYEKGWAF